MKIHLGLLDEKPHENRSWLWMRRGEWHDPTFPADVYREIAIWMAMPGFEMNYHCHVLGFSRPYLMQMRKGLPTYEELKPDVLDNFASVTLDDAVKLFKLRKNKTSGIPLVCQMFMIDEFKRGRTISSIARTFGSCPIHTGRIVKRGVANVSTPLPPEFAMLALRSRNPLQNLNEFAPKV